VPFVPFYPRKFSLASISAYAPNSPGVYGLSNASRWIFIGEADNIRAALLEHLQRPNPAVGALGPTGFIFEVCPPPARAMRWRRLVREYSPACNVEAVQGPPPTNPAMAAD
jgi:hypothetical protein